MIEDSRLVPDKKGQLDARRQPQHLKAVDRKNLPLAQQVA